MTDRDFIDHDPAQMLELDAAEPAAQRTLLNAFDQVPTDLEMFGHIPDGHVVGQLQNVPLERMGVGASLVGEIRRLLGGHTCRC